jgi:pimeloyl-ACP methyl ester carboxylesterase
MNDMAASTADHDLDAEARRVLDALRPRRRARPRLAEALREAEDREVDTPFGPVMAWRLAPWGSSPTTPAALLVHGWEDDNCLWGPMIEALIEAGRPIVAFDLPGHGFSPAEDCSVGRAAAAILAVAEAMGPVDALVAHSFGCPASTRAMADGLVIRRAALIATPMPTATGNYWPKVKERMDVSDAVIDRAQTLMMAQEAIFPPFDYPALAAGMSAKALFVHSLDDEECPPANSRALADAWPGAQTLWVDDLGHRRLAQDAATVARVAAFIEG